MYLRSLLEKIYNDSIRQVVVFSTSVDQDMAMLSNTTFNNILVILWLSDLLVEETRVPRENHRPVASH